MRHLVLVGVIIVLGVGGGAVADPVELPEFYVGFEDREARDYDYNDFGMTLAMRETRDELGLLVGVDLVMEARCHLAGDVHDVHLTRRFAPETRYAWTLDRIRPAEGSESPALMGPVLGAGDLDVVLFDTAYVVPGDMVRLTVALEEPLHEAPFDPTDSPYGAEGSWARYDPWLYDRVVGAERHLRDAQQFRASGIDLPYVLVLPFASWEAPPENTPVMDVYPDFTEYFATGDERLVRWYDAVRPDEAGR